MAPAPNARLTEAPREAVIRFSERVEPRPSSLEVLDARGQRVDRGDAAVDPADPWRYRVTLSPLASGAYTVSWRVLSADDGHVTHGAHVFTVGVAGEAGGPSAPTVRSGVGWRPLARWMVAMGGALLLGALVAGPLLGVGASRGSRGMEVLGGTAVALGGTLDLVLQALQLAGPRPLGETLAALLTAPPGRVWLLRVGLLSILAVVGRAGVGGRWVRIGLATALVMTGGLVSHGAAATEGRWLVLGLEALHLLAMASWVGGLMGFATLFWQAGPGRAATLDIQRLALAIPAFSGLAVLAVGSLAVSGLVLARLHLAAWDELLGTTYGRWLTAKLGVFAVMLALGGWHQRRIAPALTRQLERRETTSWWPWRFRRSIRVEAGLGVVALALAGALGVTAPPAPPGAPPPPAGFHHERVFEEARVRVEIAPLHPGPNAIRLVVTDPAGRPLADATAAMIQVTPVDASVGAVTFQLDRAGPGEFVAGAAVLGLVGRWNGRLVVQRSGAYDVNDRFELVVSESPSAHAHGGPAGPPHRPVPLDRVSGGAALATAAITLALYLHSRRRLRAARLLLADTPQPLASTPAPR